MSNTPTSSAQVAEGLNLLDCPFCGCTPDLLRDEDDCPYVACSSCHISLLAYRPGFEHKAIAAWNRRTAAPVAEGVALPPLDVEGLPPLTDEQIVAVVSATFADDTMNSDDFAFARAIEREVVATYAERIRQLERELADWKKSNQLLAASRDRWKDAAGAAS